MHVCYTQDNTTAVRALPRPAVSQKKNPLYVGSETRKVHWRMVERGERLGKQTKGSMHASVKARWKFYYDMRDVLRDPDG